VPRRRGSGAAGAGSAHAAAGASPRLLPRALLRPVPRGRRGQIDELIEPHERWSTMRAADARRGHGVPVFPLMAPAGAGRMTSLGNTIERPAPVVPARSPGASEVRRAYCAGMTEGDRRANMLGCKGIAPKRRRHPAAAGWASRRSGPMNRAGTATTGRDQGRDAVRGSRRSGSVAGPIVKVKNSRTSSWGMSSATAKLRRAIAVTILISTIAR